MMENNQSWIHLCAPDWLGMLPLTGAFLYSGLFPEYRFYPATFAETEQKLQSRLVDTAFISAISFTRLRRYLNLAIVPDIAFSVRFGSATALLLFRKGLSTLRTIAVDHRSPAETVLLKILLREKFRTEAELISMPPNPVAMLEHADAALITGNEALAIRDHAVQAIDLIEEWEDLTEGLPFVSGFWAGISDRLNSSIRQDLVKAYHEGEKRIMALSDEYAAQHPGLFNSSEVYQYCSEIGRYSFGDEEKDSIREFYSYCYYFGWIDEIPELQV